MQNYPPISFSLEKFQSCADALSHGQQGLWLLYEMAPQSFAHNTFITTKICSELNFSAFQYTWKRIFERHSILRTTYTSHAGIPKQQVHSPKKIDIQIIDASGWSEDRLKKQIFTETDRPFNLEVDSVLRIHLFTQSVKEHVLLLTMNHIAGDLWSFDVLLNEFQTFYTAEFDNSHLQDKEFSEKFSYTRFPQWQSELLSSSKGEQLWKYWQQKLAGELPVLLLPTDRPRPPMQTYREACRFMELDEELLVQIKDKSLDFGTSLYHLLLTTFYLLLYRYTHQEDILVGVPMLGRWGRAFKKFEKSVGYFANPTALRVAVSGEFTFAELLSQVGNTLKEAQQHQDYPFPLLVRQLQPQRDPSRSPLFQVTFTSQKQRWYQPEWDLAQRQLLRMEPYLLGHHRGTTSDLDVSVIEVGEWMQICWQFNPDLFDSDTITRMSGHFQTLLKAIVINPDLKILKLPLLTETERHQLLVELNDTQTDYPQDKCIHQLFEEQVERSPDEIAVVFEDQQLTYRELNTKANQLAHYLQTLGVKAEVLVGICVERSLEMIIGILGILKAGGAYVPLDPAYPQERLDFMIEDANVSLILTQSQLADRLPIHQSLLVSLDKEWQEIARQSGENLIQNVKSDNLAYVIYTSGSTGTPKGVLIEHKSLVNYTLAAIAKYDINDRDRILQFTSLNFDVSAEEIYACLTTGASLRLRTELMLASSQTFLKKCQEWGITVAILPTAYWHELTAKLESDRLSLPPALKLVVVGGERVLATKVEQWQRYVGKQVRLINAYGPTEATISALWCDLSELNPTVLLSEVPIGRPIANTQLYILDQYLQLVPIGVSGELFIGGDGLARGYLNRPDLTAEKFISNPFSSTPLGSAQGESLTASSNDSNSRLYKTGDLARYLPDGNIEFLGRIDHQVKIRGFRIELGEIESALSQHPDVREAIVVVREDKLSNKRLFAYITSTLIPDRLPYQSECLLELNGNIFKLQTADISSGGVGVVAAPMMAEGMSIRLRLLLPGSSETQWFGGQIAWSKSTAAGIKLQLTSAEQIAVNLSLTHLQETQGLWKTWQRTIATSLRNYLKGKLPDHMMPNAFVLLDAMPLTPNGKIDRCALSTPDQTQEQQGKDFVAPSTPTEKSVAAIWQEVLGISQIGIQDNFFELGGHSLLSFQIISRVCEAFSIDLPISTLFESPTVAALSQEIEAQITTQPNERAKTKSAIVPIARNIAIPLSFSQSHLWHTEKYYAGDRAANSPVTLKLTGSLSPKILEQSFNEIICRHEILRTTFPIVEGEPIQNIYPFLNVPLETIDLQHLPNAERVVEAEKIIREAMNHCFDLATAPLIKTVLIQISDEEQWLLILMHHLITDGWSYGVFMQELETLYTDFLADRPSSLPEPPFQYADFTIWQRNYLREEDVAEHLHYWQKRLASLPVPLDLLPVIQPEADKCLAAEHHFCLPVGLTSAIEIFSNAHSVTPFITLLTALKILLSKWSQQSDILIVGTMANRDTSEIEQLLGCFIGDLPVRCQVKSDETGAALLKKVKQAVTEGITNTLPAEKIWEPFEEEVKTLRTVLLTMFSAVKCSSQALKFEELNINSDRGLWDDRHLPLELYVVYPTEIDRAIEFYSSYSTSTFTAETIEYFLQSYQAILDRLIRYPETIFADFPQKKGTLK
jgi:amino acid adenylation domain-containing protein